MSLFSRSLSAALLAGLSTAAAAHDDHSWTRISDVGRNPVTETKKEQFDFSATGRIDVKGIGGRVDVKAGANNRVEFVYERRGATQQDLDCETLRFEQDKEVLRIWSEEKRTRACRVVRAADTLTLTVPRGASVELREIGDSVTVTSIEGLVRLESIGDSVVATGVQQVDADSIGDSVKLEVTRVGPRGIRVDSVGDTVELTLPERIDARLFIGSVGDEVRGPGLRLTSRDDDYETVLGDGGPMIKIDSVGDTVVIRGPRLSQPERDERRSRQSYYY